MKYVLSRRAGIALLVLAALLIAAPMLLPGEGTFSGTDDAASAAIAASHPDYHRWIVPFWQAPSKEVENALFALEAALGGGVLGYVLGRMHRKRDRDLSDR